MSRLSEIEQTTKYAKELIQVIKNPVAQTPFTIGDSQLQAINILEKLFNTMQPDTIQNTVVPREVPTITPTRVPVTVTPPRFPLEVIPPRVMTPRTPIIT